MRKLVLFGALGCVFALALLLEHFVTRPATIRSGDPTKLVMVLGGGVAREIPPTPPVDSPQAANPGDGFANGKQAADTKQGGSKRGDARDAAHLQPPAGGATNSDANALGPVALAKEHVVAKGETLAIIARSELGSSNKWHDLARWNGIDDPNQLRAGAKLRLTPPADVATAKSPATPPTTPAANERTHRIAKGDTLSHIAAMYLGDASRWHEIERLNGIADPANLTEGATLRLPQH